MSVLRVNRDHFGWETISFKTTFIESIQPAEQGQEVTHHIQAFGTLPMTRTRWRGAKTKKSFVVVLTPTLSRWFTAVFPSKK
jgi:hypothetical protein